jgi:hypothetical protein
MTTIPDAFQFAAKKRRYLPFWDETDVRIYTAGRLKQGEG